MAKDGLGKKRNRAVRTHTGATRVGVVEKKERIDGDGPQCAMDRIAICCLCVVAEVGLVGKPG